MSDLLSDLEVDRGRSRAVARPAVPVPAGDGAAAAGHPSGGRRVGAAATPAPSVTVRVTPLHWSRPAVGRAGAAWTLGVGPLQVVLALR